jgi:hypothetical protein
MVAAHPGLVLIYGLARRIYERREANSKGRSCSDFNGVQSMMEVFLQVSFGLDCEHEARRSLSSVE